MKKIKKGIESLTKKSLVLFLILGLLVTTSSFTFISSVFAQPEDQKITFVGGVKEEGEDVIQFFDENNALMGRIKVKIKDVDTDEYLYFTPVDNEIVLPTYSDDYEVKIEFNVEPEYDLPTYEVNDELEYTPGEGGEIGLQVTSDENITVKFNFQPLNSRDGNSHYVGIYPIYASFEGITDSVGTVGGAIALPNGWESGKVTFQTEVCKQGDEYIPLAGDTNCDSGTVKVVDLMIQGINNLSQINYTVAGGHDNTYITIKKGFLDYGKVGLHLVNLDYGVNTAVDLFSNSLINVEADAPMRMAHSYGLETITQAVVTTATTGNVSIFFGNTEAILRAGGPNVVGITKLTGAKHVLNEDKTVTVSLPPLNQETTTKVTITIELMDGKTVERNINIVRTALELAYEGENKTIRAGYVMHKGYLYNNKPHSDDIFDAYFQVVIYRDDVVVGYNQIQIDDEELVNSLGIDESGSIDSGSPDSPIIYDGSIKGANKVSVFLTNGPIDYNSDTLPSIEFGLGAGVELKWEVK